MDARQLGAARVAAGCLILAVLCADARAANYRTQNFLITAATPDLAREIGDSAESYRRNLAIEWLGRELPNWGQPCPISAQVSPNLGAGGATSFLFSNGQPHGWTMTIQGSHERVLDSVLPHEVTHTIFATHFGRPLPRWADEGACTTVEHSSERSKQENLLVQFLTSNRGIAFNRLFAMKEYPRDILPLYSEGFSLARFLIGMGGKQKFVTFVGDGMNSNNWTATTQKHYGFRSLSELQVTWVEWVRRGSRETEIANVVASMVPGASTPNASDIVAADNPTPGRSAPVQLASLSSAEPEDQTIGSERRFSALPPVPPTSERSMESKPGTRAAEPSRVPPKASWYARQGARNMPVEVAARPTDRPSNGAPPRSAPSPNSDGQSQMLTRPQTPEQPRQIILEWSRPPAGSATSLR